MPLARFKYTPPINKAKDNKEMDGTSFITLYDDVYDDIFLQIGVERLDSKPKIIFRMKQQKRVKPYQYSLHELFYLVKALPDLSTSIKNYDDETERDSMLLISKQDPTRMVRLFSYSANAYVDPTYCISFVDVSSKGNISFTGLQMLHSTFFKVADRLPGYYRMFRKLYTMSTEEIEELIICPLKSSTLNQYGAFKTAKLPSLDDSDSDDYSESSRKKQKKNEEDEEIIYRQMDVHPSIIGSEPSSPVHIPKTKNPNLIKKSRKDSQTPSCFISDNDEEDVAQIGYTYYY